MVALLIKILTTLAFAGGYATEKCSIAKEVLPCDQSAKFLKNTTLQLSSFSSEVTYVSGNKKKLLCNLGLKSEISFKDLVQNEVSRLAPQLQKLQELRETKNYSEANLAEVDRIEMVLKRSSLFAYTSVLDSIANQIKKERVWNPNRLSQEIEKKLTQAVTSLKKNNFPDVLLKEMSLNQNKLEECGFTASAKYSPRSYHFNKILRQNYPAPSVLEASKKCIPAYAQAELCQASSADKIKVIETEVSEQVCLLKELSPTIAPELQDVKLQIPSIAGDLVTSGPGIRPTEEEAKSKNFRLNVLCPEDVSLGGLARGAMGAAASFATHELSHEGVSRVVGQKLEWDIAKGTWSCNNCSGQIKPIAIAGLLSHSVGSEAIVQNQSNDSQFQKGWLFFNMFNTSSYFIRDWMARSGKTSKSSWAAGTIDSKGAGDLRAFSKKESYLMGSLMIAHQLYSGYRYLKKRQDYQCKKEW